MARLPDCSPPITTTMAMIFSTAYSKHSLQILDFYTGTLRLINKHKRDQQFVLYFKKPETMTDYRRSKKEEFRAAIRDPFVLAKVLKVPQVASTKKPTPPSKSSEHLQDNGTDWSIVLSTWLDACQAAVDVSRTVGSCTAKS
jgi:hypothetical protein